MHGQGNLILCELTSEGSLHFFKDALNRPVILLRIKSDIDDAEKIARRIRRKIIAQIHRDTQHNGEFFIPHTHLLYDGFHKERCHKGSCGGIMIPGRLQKLRGGNGTLDQMHLQILISFSLQMIGASGKCLLLLRLSLCLLAVIPVESVVCFFLYT